MEKGWISRGSSCSFFVRHGPSCRWWRVQRRDVTVVWVLPRQKRIQARSFGPPIFPPFLDHNHHPPWNHSISSLVRYLQPHQGHVSCLWPTEGSPEQHLKAARPFGKAPSVWFDIAVTVYKSWLSERKFFVMHIFRTKSMAFIFCLVVFAERNDAI